MALRVIIFLALLLCVAFAQKILLTIAYCPTYFTGAGAIVSVDARTGQWTIEKEFKWPSQIQFEGCAGAFDDPAFDFDRSTNVLYLDFVDEFGLLVELDVTTGTSRAFKPSDDFFVGFKNMALIDSSTVKGAAPTVEESGYCSDGCFGFYAMSTTTGHTNKLKDILFRAMMDDTHYLYKTNSSYYVQVSYPLYKGCGGEDYELCMIAINTDTGDTISQKLTNWTVYHYAASMDASGNVLAWIEGFDKLCNHGTAENFLFAHVNLLQATAIPIVCMDNNVIVHEAPWISDFSVDETLFATASGNPDAGVAQLLVLSTQTGKAVVNSNLNGLGQALKSVDGLFWIWSLNFVN